MVRERALVVFLALAAGCSQSGATDPVELPALDAAFYRCNVEPVLMARCGFYPCHGSELRPFRIYAPNRLRLAPSVPQLGAPLTADEREANEAMARAMAIADTVDEAQLLAKPLDVDSGGQFHRGKTEFLGRDVFSDTSDRGYQIIAAWLDGETANASCTPSTEIGP